MTIKEAIDNIFSHNEIVAIWVDFVFDGMKFSERVYRGMAHEIPERFLDEKRWKIFGTVAETLPESDTINIRLAYHGLELK